MSFKNINILLGIGGLIIGFILLPGPIEASEKPSKTQELIIKRVAAKYKVPEKLIHSIIQAESNYNPQAVSEKGAIGLMQLMPETAKHYGVNNPFDPGENIEGGVKYLKDLIKIYGQRLDLILAAYNAGQMAVKKYGGIPPYPETLNYIKKIKSSYGQTTLQSKTKIYKYYDEHGRLVLTNYPYLVKKNKN